MSELVKNRDEGRSKQWQFFNEIVTLLFVLFFMAQQFSKLTCFKGRKVGHIFATYVLLTFFFSFLELCELVDHYLDVRSQV